MPSPTGSWPSDLPDGFKPLATPLVEGGSLSDESFPGPIERQVKLRRVFGPLIFRTDWETNPFHESDFMVMNYYKEGVIRPPGAGPAT